MFKKGYRGTFCCPTVSAKVPAFGRRNPKTFLQFKVQFALTVVTTGATKFNHALVGLEEESVALVVDMLSVSSYPRLKEQLIRCTPSPPANYFGR